MFFKLLQVQNLCYVTVAFHADVLKNFVTRSFTWERGRKKAAEAFSWNLFPPPIDPHALSFRLSLVSHRHKEAPVEEGVVANKNSNMRNDGIGWHAQKQQDEQRLLAKNQPFSANCLCSDDSNSS